MRWAKVAGGALGGLAFIAGTALAQQSGTWTSEWGASATDGAILGLTAAGDSLIAYGNFTAVGAEMTGPVAFTDGTHWRALGDTRGLDGLYVTALTHTATGWWAAAQAKQPFNGSDGSPGELWTLRDGTWIQSGWRVDGDIDALANWRGSLVAGGKFHHIGDLAAPHIAQLRDSSWSGLGAGLSAEVQAIHVDGDSLYAGGAFGGVNGPGFASWNGAQWLAPGDSWPCAWLPVHQIAQVRDTLVVVAFANWEWGTVRVARRVAGVWSQVLETEAPPPLVASDGTRLAVQAGALYAVRDDSLLHLIEPPRVFPGVALAIWRGAITYTDGARIWRVDTSTARSLIPGVGPLAPVYSVAWLGDSLFIDGSRYGAEPGGFYVRHVLQPMAHVHIEQLFSTGRTMFGNVSDRSLPTRHSRFARFVGAPTPDASGSDAFARDGWSVYSVSPGVVTTVIDFHGRSLVASELSGGATVEFGVREWNGSAWTLVGDPFDGAVRSLCVVGDTLVAAGSFTHAGSVACPHLAQWDGTRWSPPATSPPVTVEAVGSLDGALYVSGAVQPGPRATSWIVAWRRDGASWSPVMLDGTPLTAPRTIDALTAFNGTLAGVLGEVVVDSLSRPPTHHILLVRIAGNRATTLAAPVGTDHVSWGAPTARPVVALAAYGRTLVASVDGLWPVASALVTWMDDPPAPGNDPTLTLFARAGLDDSEPVTIRFAQQRHADSRVDILDVRGRLIRSLLHQSLPPGAYSLTWDRRDAQVRVAPAGIYLVRLAVGASVAATRVLLLH